MILERTSNEIILKISPDINKFGMQRLLEYIEYLELTANIKTKQEQADQLADELNNQWWEENKDRYLNEGNC